MAKKSFIEEGVKVRETPLRESDVIIDIFTRGLGTIKGVVRGLRRSKKRFPGSIRKFSFYHFSVSVGKGGIFNVSGASYVYGFDELGLHLGRYCAADYGLEIISRFYPENVASNQIFDSLVEFLSMLRSGGDIFTTVKWLEVRVLHDSGFFPDFVRCSHCELPFGEDEGAYFNLETRHVSCKTCDKLGHYMLIDNVLRKDMVRALNSPCSRYFLHDPSRKDLYRRIITDQIVAKIGFFPKSLLGMKR
jgi:DNA repair protein RecO